jgi:hypothetical protein
LALSGIEPQRNTMGAASLCPHASSALFLAPVAEAPPIPEHHGPILINNLTIAPCLISMKGRSITDKNTQ